MSGVSDPGRNGRLTWSKYAELEQTVGETDRARAIFELAIGQSVLDMPEMLWKQYIDFEIGEQVRWCGRFVVLSVRWIMYVLFWRFF